MPKAMVMWLEAALTMRRFALAVAFHSTGRVIMEKSTTSAKRNTPIFIIAGIPCTIEPRINNQTKHRGDIIHHFPNYSSMVDVFMTHSLTPSRINSELKNPLKALHEATVGKQRKYAQRPEVKSNLINFVPFGTTTLGVLTPAAINHLKSFRRHQPDNPALAFNYLALQHSIITKRGVARTLSHKLAQRRSQIQF